MPVPAADVPPTTVPRTTTFGPIAPLSDLVAGAAARHPARTALVDGPSGRSVDHAELDRWVGRIAAWLAADGVGPGDRVATWAPNAPPVAAVVLATWRLGATTVPLSPAWTEPEARAVCGQADVSVVATVPSMVEGASALGARRVVGLAPVDGFPDLADLLDLGPADVTTGTGVDLDSIAALCSSSGTTGAPKLVPLTHRQLASVTSQIVDAFEATADDVTLAVAPWFHILGLTAELLVPLSVGATVVSVPRFVPDEFVSSLEAHRVSFLAIPPPVASFLASHPDLGDRDLGALDLIAVGGAALPAPVHERLAARLPGAAIGQGWGLTETSGALCVPRRRVGTPPGAVGTPLRDTELRVVDPDSLVDVAPGADGELLARGPQLMAGYLDRPAETARSFTPDGWLRTGDLGHVDPDGNVVLVDRLKDLVKVNGLQVSPTEVEDALRAHPAVSDAAVVGRRHDRTGETPVAFVVVEGVFDPEDLLAFVAARLAPYKRPTVISRVDALPRTPSGKVLRRALVDPEPEPAPGSTRS